MCSSTTANKDETETNRRNQLPSLCFLFKRDSPLDHPGLHFHMLETFNGALKKKEEKLCNFKNEKILIKLLFVNLNIVFVSALS